MKKSSPLVFFGTEDFSAASLQALIDSGWLISAVVTKPDTKSGRGNKLSSPRVKQIAKSHNIPVWQPQKLLDILSELKALKPDYGVLVAYGKIIPQSIIDAFGGGIINVHPSLLPKYLGPAPIEAAILNGDHETGISLMSLIADMDAGPVYYQEAFGLSGHENRIELTRSLAKRSAEVLVDKLPDIIDGKLSAKIQNELAATYTKLIHKRDGAIDWTKPAVQLEREVRAYAGWPKSYTQVFGQNIIVSRARIAKDSQAGTLVMPAGKSYLEILELIGPSGRTMSGADFIRGYQS